MDKNRRADQVLFGFDFQVCAAIVLMIENINDLKSLRLEGKCEDIQLELNNNTYILAQAKAVVNSSFDFHNVRANLNKALHSLSEGSKTIKIEKLIFITNSPNPLKQEESRDIFRSIAHREYKTLPPLSKQIIDRYLCNLEHPLDKEKLSIQILPFETDNEVERYKFVRQSVDEFIVEFDLGINGIGKRIFNSWKNDIFNNGTKKDPTINLTKNDIVWPIIVLATDNVHIDETFQDNFDSSLYEEINIKYEELINSSCEKFETFIAILCDYQSFQSDSVPSKKCCDFALTKWEDYKENLGLENVDNEIQKGLIQIILFKIVKSRYVIDKIKKGVYL